MNDVIPCPDCGTPIATRFAMHTCQGKTKLTFQRVIKREDIRSSLDRRKRVTRVLCEYRGSDGHEYRKSFEAARGEEADIPQHGTHEQLLAKQFQWRGARPIPPPARRYRKGEQ